MKKLIKYLKAMQWSNPKEYLHASHQEWNYKIRAKAVAEEKKQISKIAYTVGHEMLYLTHTYAQDLISF